MKVIKVFISQPMNGRPFEDVMDERRSIMDEFKKWAIASKIIDEDATVIDVNMSFADAEEGKGRIWYLGRSIQTMETADFVVFHKNYETAHGCKAENKVAMEYFQNCVRCSNAYHVHSPCYSDGSKAFGCITLLIDEIYFNRIY